MVYEIYTHLNSLDHVSPKKYHMTASSMEQQVDLTGVVVFSSTTWIWIWEFGSGRRSGKLFLGICPNIFLLGGGGSRKFGYTMHIQDVHVDAAAKIRTPTNLPTTKYHQNGRRFCGRNLLSETPPFSCAQRLASRNVTSCVATTLRLNPKFLVYQTCPKHDTNTPFSQGFLEKTSRQFLGETKIINKKHVCFWW